MVTIVADTTASLPKELYSKLGIPLLPQIIIFGNEEFRDDTEMDTASFLQKLRSSTILPKTSAPSPAHYRPVLQKYTENGGSVVILVPSGLVSGTFRGATEGAKEFPGKDIRIIDTQTIAGGLGTLILEAQKWAEQGLNSVEIEENVKKLAAREKVYFLVNTLEYLHKGGRIGGAQALVGSLLQVKPILTLRNGKVDQAESQRTKKKAFARLIELVLENCPHDDSALISVSHCDAEADAKELKRVFEETLGISNIPIYELPPAIVVHAGPGALSVSYFVKE